MKQSKRIPFIIFSVDKGEDKDKDFINRCDVIDAMERDGRPFKRVGGCYKGIEEVSFLVPLEEEGWVFDVCKRYKQGAYVRVFDTHVAEIISLVELDGDVVKSVSKKGVWRRAKMSERPGKPDAADSYTYDPYTHEYWVIE